MVRWSRRRERVRLRVWVGGASRASHLRTSSVLFWSGVQFETNFVATRATRESILLSFSYQRTWLKVSRWNTTRLIGEIALSPNLKPVTIVVSP
ncbi:hypothetical protein BDU57DRAFT_511124, partial [Ampelomyces quisqualis]